MAAETQTTGHTFYLSDLNHGIHQHPLRIPDEGLLVRLTVCSRLHSYERKKKKTVEAGRHTSQDATT
jgi:hypothetical protein